MKKLLNFKMINMRSTSLLNTCIVFVSAAALLISCNNDKDNFDASGTFEAEETIIAAEATGTILKFAIEEGDELSSGQNLGFIDSTQVYLKKKQLLSQIQSTLSQRPDIAAQIASLEVQLSAAQREQTRLSNLVKAGAATQKQLDDMTSQVEMYKKQISAQR